MPSGNATPNFWQRRRLGNLPLKQVFGLYILEKVSIDPGQQIVRNPFRSHGGFFGFANLKVAWNRAGCPLAGVVSLHLVNRGLGRVHSKNGRKTSST